MKEWKEAADKMARNTLAKATYRVKKAAKTRQETQALCSDDEKRSADDGNI
jgi:hypothetical protein